MFRRIFFINWFLTPLILTASLAFYVLPTRGAAHEVSPAIINVSVEDNRVHFELRATLEAFLVGMDLSGIRNTDESAQAQDYQALRALPPEELRKALKIAWPDWSDEISLWASGEPLELRLSTIEVPQEIGDLEIPRESLILASAPLPPGASFLEFQWSPRFGPVVLRQNGVENPFTAFLEDGAKSERFALRRGTETKFAAVTFEYILHGFDHIIPKGLDHILFVLGLFFLSLSWRALLWQVTAFTLAHSVTLALGIFGVVSVPGSIVEPLIALSIVYVAVENVFMRDISPWRPVVVFAFGLLHGLGFASVLTEFGLPAGQYIPALIGFNLGVELGQLAVIAIAFVVLASWSYRKAWYRSAIAVPASLGIAAVGLYWTIERVFLT